MIHSKFMTHPIAITRTILQIVTRIKLIIQAPSELQSQAHMYP